MFRWHAICFLIVIWMPMVINQKQFLRMKKDAKPVTEGEFPNVVSLMRGKDFKSIHHTFCAGSLLTETRIVSAMSCLFVEFVGDDPTRRSFSRPLHRQSGRRSMLHVVDFENKVFAVMGSLKKSGTYVEDGTSSNEQWRKLVSASLSCYFEFPHNDVALLYVQKPYVLNKFVNTLPYAKKYMDYAESSIKCQLVCYGEEAMLWTEVKIDPLKMCAEKHSHNMEEFICLSDDTTKSLETGDTMACPLMCQNTGDPVDKGRGVIVGLLIDGEEVNKEIHYYCNRFSIHKLFLSRQERTQPSPNLLFFCIFILFLIT